MLRMQICMLLGCVIHMMNLKELRVTGGKCVFQHIIVRIDLSQD